MSPILLKNIPRYSARELQQALKGRIGHRSLKDIEYIRDTTRNILEHDPLAKNVKVVPTQSPHSHYDPDSNTLTMGAHSPENFFEEIARATEYKSLHEDHPKLVNFSKGMSKYLGLGGIPLSVLIAKNKGLTRDDKIGLLDTLAAGSLAANIPAIIDDLGYTAASIRHSSDKLRTFRNVALPMASALGKHLSAPLSFFGARRILKGQFKSEEAAPESDRTSVSDSLHNLYEAIKSKV